MPHIDVSNTDWRQLIGSALDQIMACRLFGAMPSSKPILSYCQLDPYEQTSMNFNQNATFFINENAYENIVCEMVAILSRGETSQHTYQAILQPTMTRSVSSVNYAHGLPYPSWLRHWQWISDTIVPVPVKQPIKHDKALYNDVIMGAIASQITSLTIVFSTVYLDTDQRKHQSSASLAFVRGIPRTNGQ